MSITTEISKSAQATCVKCKEKIPKGVMKLLRAKMNSFAGRMTKESICGPCGVPLIEAEMAKLESALRDIKSTLGVHEGKVDLSIIDKTENATRNANLSSGPRTQV